MALMTPICQALRTFLAELGVVIVWQAGSGGFIYHSFWLMLWPGNFIYPNKAFEFTIEVFSRANF
jgi:hypothetical protein